MSVSGKKEFDVKQILRLRWRWFSHSTQGSAGSGGYIQQEGLDHRGSPTPSRLKNHSRERGGLRKGSSPVHSILAPTPGPTPVYARPGSQSWPQQSFIQHLPASEEQPVSGAPEGVRTGDAGGGQGEEASRPGEPSEAEARERYGGAIATPPPPLGELGGKEVNVRLCLPSATSLQVVNLGMCLRLSSVRHQPSV